MSPFLLSGQNYFPYRNKGPAPIYCLETTLIEATIDSII